MRFIERLFGKKPKDNIKQKSNIDTPDWLQQVAELKTLNKTSSENAKSKEKDMFRGEIEAKYSLTKRLNILRERCQILGVNNLLHELKDVFPDADSVSDVEFGIAFNRDYIITSAGYKLFSPHRDYIKIKEFLENYTLDSLRKTTYLEVFAMQKLTKRITTTTGTGINDSWDENIDVDVFNLRLFENKIEFNGTTVSFPESGTKQNLQQSLVNFLSYR
ncbi:MAG TPA: hypothetical protein VG895_04565 [Patescibacteria group bacterium]|nr:hypothetical protein [Patescibacteria group bacterium]